MGQDSRSLVSPRNDGIRTSATLAVSGLAARLRREGRPVISFGAGEPDLPTPEPVRRAAIEAIQQNRGRYTAAAGLTELREAVAGKFEKDGFPCTAGQVVITAGAKTGLFEALFVLSSPGDEVLFPAPYWSSYWDMIVAAGAVPRPVPTLLEDGFQPRLDALRAQVTAKTRVLLINSPNNPTGCIYEDAALEACATVAREHDLAVITDDIYEHLLYTGQPFRNILRVAPDLDDHCVIINGFSKSHSMTGWRLGYLRAPVEVAEAIAKLQSQISGNPSAISQYGGLAGLVEPPDPGRLVSFDRRRRLMLEEIQAIPELRCPEPLGAFYAFPDISAYLGRRFGDQVVDDDLTLTRLLLEDQLVACVPGTVFGSPGHLRLTYACSEDEIREGVRRIGTFLASLS